MIPLIANIKKAIYCLNKRIDLLDNLIKDMLGLDSSSISSLINILNDKDASTGILNTLLLKADKSEIPAAQILSDWNLQNDTKLDYIKNKPSIPTVPSNELATNGGTTLSVVTTGDKYNWNNKANIWRGTLDLYDALSPNYDNNTVYIIIESS